MRFTLLIASIFRTFNEQYFHYQEGSIDESMWKSLTVPIEDLVGYRGPQKVWNLRRHHYSEAFQTYIDRVIELASSKAMPLYPEEV